MPNVRTATPAEPTDEVTETTGEDTWAQRGYHAANTGHNPDAAPPRRRIREEWEIAGALGEADILGTPIVADGTVYVGTGRRVHALDRATGEERWRTDTDQILGFFTPATADGRVFVVGSGSDADAVLALRTGDGSIAWRRTLEANASPVVADGRLYVHTIEASSGQVRALDPADGSDLWTRSLGCRSPIAVPATDGKRVYVSAACGEGTLVAMDATDGTERWRFATDGDAGESAPAVAHGAVYVGDTAGTLYAVDARSGQERWRYDVGAAIDLSPSVDDARVYAKTANDVLYALDAATGERRWRTAVPTGPTKPAVAAGTVYLGGVELTAVEAATGRQRWDFSVEARSLAFTSPVAVGETVIAASCLKRDPNQYMYDNYVHALTPAE